MLSSYAEVAVAAEVVVARVNAEVAAAKENAVVAEVAVAMTAERIFNLLADLLSR